MQRPSLPKVNFPETRWTWVVEAGRNGDAPGGREAMEALCQVYWRPVYAYLRRDGHSSHDAEDFTQGFFVHLLESPFFRNASPEEGRLRTYLLGALKNYVASNLRKGRAAKRGGGHTPLPLDFTEAETWLTADAFHGDPSALFDRQWALDLLEAVYDRLEKHYRETGRALLFAAVKNRLLGAEDGRSGAEIAKELGMEYGAFKVAFHRMRKRFRNTLREEVTKTLESDGSVEEELRYLSSVFRME